jgi:sensor histidine kinase YesM
MRKRVLARGVMKLKLKQLFLPTLTKRLIKYFLLIICIMFVIVMSSTSFLKLVSMQSESAFGRLKNMQDLIIHVQNMGIHASSYSASQISDYHTDFLNDYKLAKQNSALIMLEYPGNNIYRDIDVMIDSYYKQNYEILDQIQRGNETSIFFYSHKSSLENIKTAILSTIYEGMSNEIMRASSISSHTYATINQASVPIYLIVIAITLICIGFSFKFSVNFVNPIFVLSQKLQLVASGNLNTRAQYVEKEDELKILFCSFNHMVDEINKKMSVERLLQEERLKNIENEKLLNQAELKFLQMQINPHFLFNTMGSISALAQIESASKSKAMIDSLSVLLRYNLTELNNMVFLQDEINIVKHYLYIQKMRFQNKLTYEINIGKEYYHMRVPAMILQPMVENAIIHGIEPKETEGSVYVGIQSRGDFYNIIIKDDGVGMSVEQLQMMRNAHDESMHDTRGGVGFINVKRRLEIIYRKNIVKINSTLKQGTVICIGPLSKNDMMNHLA